MPPFAPASRLEVDGTELAYRRTGSGSPVLLLHGIPTSSRVWDGVGSKLVGDFDVLAPDLLGYGESSKPPDRDVSVSAQVLLVVGLLERLGIKRAAVIGHDIGGAVAQILAVRHPERLTALGLIDSVCFDSWPIPAMRALTAAAPIVERLPPGWLLRTLERGIRQEVPPDAYEAVSACLAAWTRDADALRAFLRNAAALDSRHTLAIAPQLGEIAVPTHIVWGAADRYQKAEWAPRLRDAIPGATLRMLDAGHFVPWVRPREVTAEIRSLLERVG